MPPFTLPALLALAAFLLTGLLTAFVRRELVRRAVLDRPNERSMHTQPIPRGGGLAIMLVVLPLLALTTATPWPVLLAALILVLVSWLDDRKGASAVLRFGAHIIAAFLGTFAFTADQTLFDGFLPLGIDRAIMILGWAWFINLTNFMDGLDGLTGTQTISTAAGAGLLFFLMNQNDSVILAALLVGACGGFLWHNWHPARIFLGDVGSVPLGFLTAYLLLTLAVHHHFAAALILPLYYLADSGLTLAKRVLRREKFWQAHRQHFYQRAAQGLKKHSRVVLGVLLADALLIPTAFLSDAAPIPALALAFIIVAFLLAWMHKKAAS